MAYKYIVPYIVVNIQMSTDKVMKLTDYLPPEHKEKVLNLVKRLHQQTESKNQYMNLYRKAVEENQALKQKCTKLRDQNDYLKQQIHNSFSIVSQVRANFKANKNKPSTSAQKSQEEWSDESDQQEQNKAITANQSTIVRPPRPAKSPLENYRPQMTSAKKDNRLLNLSTSYLNQTNLSSAKSKEVEEMKRQVRALQQQRKKEQEKDKEFEAKCKLVNQIKNRFKNNQTNQNESDSRQRPIQSIDITNTFENEDKIGRSNQKIARIKSTESLESKKQKTVQPLPKVSKVPQQQKAKVSISDNKKMVTPEDYGDVLDMINCYNL